MHVLRYDITCCDVISHALHNAYPVATQKGVTDRDLCLYQLQCTCKCMYIPYGFKFS